MRITEDKLTWVYAAAILVAILAVLARSVLSESGRAREANKFREAPDVYLFGGVGILIVVSFLLWILDVGKPFGVWSVIAMAAWAAVGIAGHDLRLRRERRRRMTNTARRPDDAGAV